MTIVRIQSDHRLIDKNPLIDNFYAHVKSTNAKRGEEQPKMSVMMYLNIKKAKEEKGMEDSKNNAQYGDRIAEDPDETLTDETGSDDMYGMGGGRGRRGGTEKMSTIKSRDDSDNGKKNDMGLKLLDAQEKNIQKRISLLINSRYMPGFESAEKLIEKLQEITEIVCEHFFSFLLGFIVEIQIKSGR